MPKIEGSFDKKFEKVNSLFTRHFLTGEEENAQLCVYVGDDKVIDIWGKADPESAYNPESLQVRF